MVKKPRVRSSFRVPDTSLFPNPIAEALKLTDSSSTIGLWHAKPGLYNSIISEFLSAYPVPEATKIKLSPELLDFDI